MRRPACTTTYHDDQCLTHPAAGENAKLIPTAYLGVWTDIPPRRLLGLEIWPLQRQATAYKHNLSFERNALRVASPVLPLTSITLSIEGAGSRSRQPGEVRMPASIRFESAEVTAPKLAVVETLLSLLSTLASILETSTAPTETSHVSFLNLATALQRPCPMILLTYQPVPGPYTVPTP